MNDAMRDDSFDIYGTSDIGRQRTDNQDHFLVADLRRQLLIRQTDIPQAQHEQLFGCQEGNLLVIADGMVGHEDGEVASRTAVESAAHYVLDMMHWFLKLSPGDEQQFEDELAGCLKAIQQKIWAGGDSSKKRMGTTVTMAYLLWPRMFVVHAGDSRCYLYRSGTLRRLTTDHTIAQRLIDSGTLECDEAFLAKWRHVLWNCVGGSDRQVRPEAVRTDLEEGDVVLLCSDGLTGMINDMEIAAILAAAANSEVAAQQLIQAANSAGGSDNISAIVCRVQR